MSGAGGQALESVAPQAAKDLEEAYRLCERIARAHYENFPVVSWLIPRQSRRALAAVYAFARQADDFADEGNGPYGPSRDQRLAALDDWERRLHGAFRDPPKAQPVEERSGPLPAGAGDALVPAHAPEIFLALGDAVRRHEIPVSLLLDLLSAFRQDVLVGHYASRAELLDYCRRSANPIGRIVLAVRGIRDERLQKWSDEICSGLQLANFWQDIGIDRRKNRIYLPREDLERFGSLPVDLDQASAPDRLRSAVRELTGWARGFFERGSPLIRAAPRGLRIHLGLVWHGGMKILRKIEASDGDVLAHRPVLTRKDWPPILLRALAGQVRP